MLWSLNGEEFEQLSRSNCHFCGTSPDPLGCMVRINQKGNFNVTNLQPCCEICVHMKKKLFGVDFVAHAAKIATHNTVYEDRARY